MKRLAFISVSFAFLYLSFSAYSSASELCPKSANLRIHGLDENKIVLFGEMHGTVEGPAYFDALVCTLLNTRHHLLVALEIPRDEQTLIDAFMLSDGSPAATSALLAGKFWQRPDQDGRSSRAMLDLLRSLARLKHETPGLTIIANDIPMNSSPEARANRDEAMARSLESRLRTGPEDLVAAVLIGNFHNRRRTSSDVSWNPNFLSQLENYHTLSLSLATSGGTAWTCQIGSECKAGSFGAFPDTIAAEPGQFIALQKGKDHYDGVIFVGRISASSPAASK